MAKRKSVSRLFEETNDAICFERGAAWLKAEVNDHRGVWFDSYCGQDVRLTPSQCHQLGKWLMQRQEKINV